MAGQNSYYYLFEWMKMVFLSVENLLLMKIQNFSLFRRLQWIFAWVLYFIDNGPDNCGGQRKAIITRSGPLLPDELEASSSLISVNKQYNFDYSEMKHFKNSPHVKNLKLPSTFSRFLWFPQGGRKASPIFIAYCFQHALLLPKDTHLSKLQCSFFMCYHYILNSIQFNL